MPPRLCALLAVTAALGLSAPAIADDGAHDHAGVTGASPVVVHFPISCGDDAQRKFDRAVAMLHSFMGTVQAFTAIARDHPDCAMAYWGIAISERPNPLAPPFPRENLEAGWRAIEQARAARQQTPRERGFIEALALFFQDYPRVDQHKRTVNYRDAMRELHAHYPDDIEAAVFYALALDEAADLNDTTYASQLEAASILEALWPRAPDHPGIPHYLIHSYDYPPLAARGLEAARRYAQMAPSVHALHMPSHIFAMLGHWREVIAEERKTDAAVIALYPADSPEHNEPWRIPGRYHTLDFLMTAQLQLAHDREAAAILDQRNRLPEFPAGFRITGHTAYAAIPARFALERGAWADAAKLAVAPSPYPQAQAITLFARALGAARSGDAMSARRDLAQLAAIGESLRAENDLYWVSQVEMAHDAAEAWVDFAQGHAADARAKMQRAAEIDDHSEKHIAMENRLVPMRALLGELLLQSGDPAGALTEFAASLRTSPNRYRAIAGAAAAAEQLGDRAHAHTYYEMLLALCRDADGTRPELAAARRFLGSE